MDVVNRLSRAAASGLAAIAAITLTAAPPATAAIVTVGPGDRIDYVRPRDSQFCTIGYTFIGRDRDTYAITAGHCVSGDDGQIRAPQTGATGSPVRTAYEPTRAAADYALIDFGPDAVPMSFIGAAPVNKGATPQPTIGQRVCRLGVSSGEQCGRTFSRHGRSQYLTTGMGRSIPGDSGGPVYTVGADRSATVIGIWLGEHTDPDGTRYGRFGALQAAQQDLGIR